MKATQTCSIPDCRAPRKSRGWCGKHLERWRRWGDPTETRPRIRGACSVDGCDRLSDTKGMCNTHYLRARRAENPPQPRRRTPLAERLNRHTDKSGGPDACWPWTGHRNARGYGYTSIQTDVGRVRVGAYRAAYIATHGPIPGDLFVLHNCHNPPCCNPAHLRLGTHLENMADRMNEGAGYARGDEHPAAVQVSPEAVAAIRATYRPGIKGRGQHALAQRFGLSRTTVQRIVTETDRWAASA